MKFADLFPTDCEIDLMQRLVGPDFPPVHGEPSPEAPYDGRLIESLERAVIRREKADPKFCTFCEIEEIEVPIKLLHDWRGYCPCDNVLTCAECAEQDALGHLEPRQ